MNPTDIRPLRSTTRRSTTGVTGHTGRVAGGQAVDVMVGVGQLRSATLYYVEQAVSGRRIGLVRRGHFVVVLQAIDSGAWCAPYPEGATVPVDVGLLRSAAGRYLDMVAAGTVITIVCHGHPVAQMVPRDHVA